MTGTLRLGPLPKAEKVRLTISLPAAVKADLDRYAELYAAAYGGAADAAALAAHMLAAFMERDRVFRRARQEPGLGPGGVTSPASIKAATSNTRATADDTSEPK